MTFADIVHELSHARKDWATTFLWYRAFSDAHQTDGKAKAAADVEHIERLTHAEARYEVALSAIKHGYSIAASLRDHGLEVSHAEHPRRDSHEEPDSTTPDAEPETQDCGD